MVMVIDPYGGAAQLLPNMSINFKKFIGAEGTADRVMLLWLLLMTFNGWGPLGRIFGTQWKQGFLIMIVMIGI